MHKLVALLGLLSVGTTLSMRTALSFNLGITSQVGDTIVYRHNTFTVTHKDALNGKTTITAQRVTTKLLGLPIKVTWLTRNYVPVAGGYSSRDTLQDDISVEVKAITLTTLAVAYAGFCLVSNV